MFPAISALVRQLNVAGYELEAIPVCFIGRVGITLYTQWCEPLDSSDDSKQAAERGLQFHVSFQTNFCHYWKVEPYTLPTARISFGEFHF
jgi:hypothetical protein